ncbi:hypothetical protein CEXT_222061 [Caerostris extrusa]|uniref:Uncharacterized protein n=1 Tax=Caerostris extrusa TaxID=172846 RepID=A0AAV4VU50_CAEEX|nr:hypothetical protein CEXT_222061 [Caerostris extrusa]
MALLPVRSKVLPTGSNYNNTRYSTKVAVWIKPNYHHFDEQQANCKTWDMQGIVWQCRIGARRFCTRRISKKGRLVDQLAVKRGTSGTNPRALNLNHSESGWLASLAISLLFACVSSQPQKKTQRFSLSLSIMKYSCHSHTRQGIFLPQNTLESR